ncbi:hypothetical protein [Lentibacillus saliphilus]|uniref:hypothetical protein n=1 Tax=Lentibacillus saliphilus TaxID=2737028 RepID=UPI001C2FD1F5|nr:hypothetical protein [Lentibacillus saliphilus]
MKERIHAYFRSEDDAESARAKLQALRVSDIVIEAMPNDEGAYFSFPMTGPSAGVTRVTASEVASDLFGTEKEQLDQAQMRPHILEAQVEASHYDAAQSVLREAGGYSELDKL